MTDLFQRNLELLRLRYPDLAQWMDSAPDRDKLRVLRAKDGSVFYAVVKNGRAYPLTDSAAPTKRIQAQLDAQARPLSDFTRPVLVVGFYPGNELLCIFDQSERVTTPHAEHQIVVIVDSPLCLNGFLQSWDAARVLASSRVRLLHFERMPDWVYELREHPERPHVCTLISGAREEVLARVLAPLADLIAERDQETRRLCAENDRYYDSLPDRMLADIIAGRSGRKPRIMIPTASWSTFIQHSARDAAAAFQDLGWEALLLKLDGLMTPYFLARKIHEFKPDVFLFIDHLRYEAEEVYPRNLMMVTWVQDEMNHIHCLEAGRKLAEYSAARKRDLVIGHTAGLDTKFDYPPDRLVSLSVPADPRIFHPVTLSPGERARFGCEMAFMSNVSLASERVVDEKIVPLVQSLGIARGTVEQIHDHLWAAYRAGRVFTQRDLLVTELRTFPEFQAAWGVDETEVSDGLKKSRDELLRLFYWRLNDILYRHVVLEWADELGLDLHLYGRGWEYHPRFKKYARGVVAHGSELNTAYQAAGLNLHLNVSQGMHQRMWEIMNAGAHLFIRHPLAHQSAGAPPCEFMRKLASELMKGKGIEALESAEGKVPLPDEFLEWVFRWAYATALREINGRGGVALDSSHLLKQLEDSILSRPAWILPDWEGSHFASRDDFEAKTRARFDKPGAVLTGAQLAG
ncbi:MAG: hypothetical protein V2A34_00970 [Lentisphaerota bacterium]